MDLAQTLATELDRGRARTLGLLDPLPDHVQTRQHSALMSPVVWDLAHVGNYEEIWLLGRLGFDRVEPEYDGVYDAALTPRAERMKLPIMAPGQARTYLNDVRGRVFDGLERVAFDPDDPLLRDGYLYRMVIQHEHMHDETILAALQLLEGDGYRGWAPDIPLPATPPGRFVAVGEVLVEGGPFVMGTDDDQWSFDNERRSHVFNLGPYFIDTTPVTNGEFLRFVEAGGYQDARHWSAEGWAWRQKAGLERPQFWAYHGSGSWSVDRFGHRRSLVPGEPVQHVCWYEADAYARWAGKRLPTEAEWEKAASWDPATRTKRRFPWGDADPVSEHANLGHRFFGPSSAGAYPDGASAVGCLQMIGDVWEWTSSDFEPYPGFGAFPYEEYSKVFFGPKYKVLRGGSWATHPTAIRATFRNWDFPIRRQIFCGFRCARDA